MTIYDLSERLNWKQACEVLGCGKTKLYALIRNGKLPSYRVGARGMYVLRTDCKRLMTPCAERSEDQKND